MDLDLAQELSFRLAYAVQEESSRTGNRGVHTIFDVAEDRYEDAGEEDDDLEWRNSPKLVHSIRWGDEVSDGVDDDRSEGRVRDIEEHCWEGVDGKQHNHGGDDTGKRRAHACLRFDCCARE